MTNNLRVSGWNDGVNVLGFSALPTGNDRTSWVTSQAGLWSMANYREIRGNTTSTGGDEKYTPHPLRCVKVKAIPKEVPSYNHLRNVKL